VDVGTLLQQMHKGLRLKVQTVLLHDPKRLLPACICIQIIAFMYTETIAKFSERT
jgi:hypothetical protein